MCREIYNSNGEVTTQKYDYNIFYIVCLQYFLYRYINMPLKLRVEDQLEA
jgi:hypothetical protein